MSSAGRDEIKEWRKQWSHKPTPIPLDAGGLWYSEECVDQMLADFSSALTRENRELREACEAMMEFLRHAEWDSHSTEAHVGNMVEQARAALAQK